MGQLSFIVYSDAEECGGAIAKEIEHLGHGSETVVASDARGIQKALAEGRFDALVFDLGHAAHVTLDLIQELGVTDLPILTIGPTDDSRLILRALQMGIREYVSADEMGADFGPAVERLVVRGPSDGSEDGSGLAPVIAVMGAKGGVGATFVACQLATVLQSTGRETALVDLNSPIGDVALHFDLRPVYTMADLAGEEGQFDTSYLRTVLQQHRSGLRVLAAPVSVEETELVKAEHVERALELLRRECSWVVVDVSRSWNEPSIRALELASQILLISSLDLAAVSHTRQHLDVLERLGHDSARIHIVANRHTGRENLSESDFASFVGQQPEVQLPNDYPTAVEAINTGRALGDFAPRTSLHRALVGLGSSAHEWCGVEQKPQDDGASFFGRIRRTLRR
jgi:pilus assembly protein CpaE